MKSDTAFTRRQRRNRAGSRLILSGCLLLLTLVCADLPALCQVHLERLRGDLDEGRFTSIVAKMPPRTLEKATSTGGPMAAEELLLYAHALIQLERFDDARAVLDKTLSSAGFEKQSAESRAGVYYSYAALYRAKRDSKRAFELARDALAIDPQNSNNLCRYYLMVGKIFFSSGHDLSAIIWLEKAEKLLTIRGVTDTRLEIYRFLSLAWSSKSQYSKAQPYAEKLVEIAERTRFKYKYRIGLFELANLKSASGQKLAARNLFEKGLGVSIRASDTYQAKRFLSSLMLNHLYEADLKSATLSLKRLEELDGDGKFEFEKLLGRGVLAALEGSKDVSKEFFSRLTKVESYSEFHVPYWKSTIAVRERDWQELRTQSETLQKLAEKYGFREDFAGIYLNFARSYFGLANYDKAIENARKSIAAVEEMRLSADTPISLGVIETYQTAYRLLAELRFEHPDESLALTDYLKARVLRDRIDESIMRASQFPPADTRLRLEALSKKLVTAPEYPAEVLLA